MFDFHEKRKIRSILYSKISIGVLFLCTMFLSVSVYERFTIERGMAEKRNEKAVELEELKQRATVLEEKVEHLKNERGVEEEIRGRFDVARDGEHVVIILDDAVHSATTSIQPKVTDEEKSENLFFRLFKF